jgi:hypothetical protein
MARVSGSYENVVGGVSEQALQNRRAGQSTAQVNMVDDPVRGKSRRHGSVHAGSLPVALPYAQAVQETANSVAIPFFVGGNSYDLIARKDAGSAATFAFCYDKANKAFLPVRMDALAATAALASGGLSASANVGRFLYMAGNATVPTASGVDSWGATSNKAHLVAWIRGGAYSRTFTLTLTKTDNTTVTATYKTDKSAYQGVLDTSDLDPDSDAYQSDYNNRLNEYNSAVTAWIGTAAASATPENVAQKLAEALTAAGATGVTYSGAYVIVSGDYAELSIDDGGDDSLARGVGNIVNNVTQVSSRHFAGKIVKVQPETDKFAYPVYLKAVAKDGVSTGFTEVVWEETAGYLWTPEFVFCMATVHEGALCIAGSPASLASMTGLTVPGYTASAVGDDGSSPLPDFFGKKITCMFVFQDRLGVVAGSSIQLSRNGDYLNFFRKAVLSIQDDDPWQGYALGAEDDTIHYWDLFDKNLFLFGDRFQYALPGKQTFTATNGGVAIVTKFAGTTQAEPEGAGNYVFYCKSSGDGAAETTSVHQLQPGVVSEVTDSQTVSIALDTYLKGAPVEMLAMTAPNLLMLRTSYSRNRVYVYGYLDDASSGQRRWDSWGHWEWAEQVGAICGLGYDGPTILVYTMRQRTGGGGEIACEQFVRDSALSRQPYLDSLRPYGSGLAVAAIGGVGEFRFVGGAPDEVAAAYPNEVGNLWEGYEYTSSWTPSNPTIKDKNGVALTSGVLTLSFVTMGLADTGGLSVSVTDRTTNVTSTALHFTGRAVTVIQPGRQPLISKELTAPVGKSAKTCDFTVASIRWLPLTVTSLEWAGNLFYRTRRV